MQSHALPIGSLPSTESAELQELCNSEHRVRGPENTSRSRCRVGQESGLDADDVVADSIGSHRRCRFTEIVIFTASPNS